MLFRVGNGRRRRRSHSAAERERHNIEKSDSVVHAPQRRLSATRRRREPREGHGRHIDMGHGVPQSRSGHTFRAHSSRQLSRHQRPLGHLVQDRRQHGQRQESRRDSQDF